MDDFRDEGGGVPDNDEGVEVPEPGLEGGSDGDSNEESVPSDELTWVEVGSV